MIATIAGLKTVSCCIRLIRARSPNSIRRKKSAITKITGDRNVVRHCSLAYANFDAGEKLYHRDAELLSQWAPETRYVPMWAHCDHFEDVTMDPGEWLETARVFHFVVLSNPKDESSTRDIFDRWIKDGAYDSFAKKLGYRFRLVRAELPKTLRPGSGCEVQIEMANDGFARVTNHAPSS
jgi:hypothetical protein